MNKLYVGEYRDSYVGGSLVFISEDRYLPKIEMNGLKVILDSFNTQSYRLLMGANKTAGVSPEEFWNFVNNNNFTDEFKNFLRIMLEGTTYPGYSDKRIRIDWMLRPRKGIYIVFELEIDDEVYRITDILDFLKGKIDTIVPKKLIDETCEGDEKEGIAGCFEIDDSEGEFLIVSDSYYCA